MRAMRWLGLILLISGCPKPAVVASDPDSGPALAQVVDAGPVVTEARLAAWLAWQEALSKLPPLARSDGGAGLELRHRAREEAQLLADAGLTSEQADELEAVVAAVVAERNVAKLSGADALQQFRNGMAQLSPEQRLKAEAALADLQAKSPRGSLAAVEEQFGVEAVRVVLTREAEVTKTWDALLEGREGKGAAPASWSDAGSRARGEPPRDAGAKASDAGDKAQGEPTQDAPASSSDAGTGDQR